MASALGADWRDQWGKGSLLHSIEVGEAGGVGRRPQLVSGVSVRCGQMTRSRGSEGRAAFFCSAAQQCSRHAGSRLGDAARGWGLGGARLHFGSDALLMAVL